MSLKSDAKSEELATLVRIEEVQPSREEQIDTTYTKESSNKVECNKYESYGEYLEDDDSNIGSMVSIKSETVSDDHCYSEKYIVPDLEPLYEIPIEKEKTVQAKVSPSESWPTLEILPGGVIRHTEKSNECNMLVTLKKNEIKDSSMARIYACAKCSYSFKDLCSLVKHVKCHDKYKPWETFDNRTKRRKTKKKIGTESYYVLT